MSCSRTVLVLDAVWPTSGRAIDEAYAGAMSSRRAPGLRRNGKLSGPQILRRGFDGALHLPGDPGYDAARRPLNPSLDPRPGIVAVASSPRDVQAALIAARDGDLPVTVQATGHGLRSSYDGGLLINTSGMSSVRVDPDRRIARVGPGATWGQ